MKLILQNRTLAIAIAVSVMAHVVLLAIRFVPPDAFKFKPASPGLEVILVNAKHEREPMKPQALAQANLDGGGEAADGRSASPLPNLGAIEDGSALHATQRRLQEAEQQAQRTLSQLRTKTEFRISTQGQNSEKQARSDGDGEKNAIELRRREAEIARRLEDYNRQPKKTQITPSTREVGYAMYYASLRTRIEKMGTLNFPQQAGKKLYGELIIYIPIFHDGSIYEREGGPRIQISSGNAALDAAAMRIVRRAAPYGRFPDNMRSTGRDDVWEVIARFNFTRDEGLEARLSGK